tara:strand:- start:175 stop:1104 length:930 start_codon:yes stop_codon:yes gene_type:complete
MALECYVPKQFTAASLTTIETANSIMDEYQQNGFDLTLRQLYYQFVARDLIENSQRSYKRLGSVISDARLAGLVDWAHITDRTRTLRGFNHYDSPSEIIMMSALRYREQKWKSQPIRMEAWIEKDALIGVIQRPCNARDIDYHSCRGYSSQSAMYEAAERFKRYNENGQRVILLHLGDHDPSGMDMTRDIAGRLRTFEVEDFEVRRIALTEDQVNTYGPPPNPAKVTDTRAADYIAKYGTESWELDALEPAVMADLINAEVDAELDQDAWDEALLAERDNKDLLKSCDRYWGHIADYIKDEGWLDEEDD